MVCATADDQSLPSDVSRVIICGGGVIGTAVSYYLAKRGVKSTVVDRCGLAAAASGRAGMLHTVSTSSNSHPTMHEVFLTISTCVCRWIPRSRLE